MSQPMPKVGQMAAGSLTTALLPNEKNTYGLHLKDTATLIAQKQQTMPKVAGSNGAQAMSSAEQPIGSSTPMQRDEATILSIIVESLDVIITTHTMLEKLRIALAKIKVLAKQATEESSKAVGQQKLAISINAI